MTATQALRHFRATALWLASFAVLSISALVLGHWVARMTDPYTAPPATTFSVPAADEDTYSPDYRDGAWHVGPTTVPLSCPEEDSCVVSYGHGSWVFVVDAGH